MIQTLLPSIHIFVALFSITVASILFIAQPKDRTNRAIILILLLFSMTSIAFGLETLAITLPQALPWIIIQIITTYATAPAVLYVGLLVLRPKTAKMIPTKIVLTAFGILPAILVISDLTGASQALFADHLLISTTQLAKIYTGGYILVDQALTGISYEFLLYQLIVFYVVVILYPALYVAIRDRKKDPEISRQALIFFGLTLIASLISGTLQDILPPTLASLLSSTLISIGIAYIGYRRLAVSQPNIQGIPNFLARYSMFNKLLLTVIGIILPSIVFIGFSTYSFFQSGLLAIANENLIQSNQREALYVSSVIKDSLLELKNLSASQRVARLFSDRIDSYQNLDSNQILTQVISRRSRWRENDQLLISAIMSPIVNIDLRELNQTNPDFTTIMLVDQYGALITASARPTDYDYSTAQWRQEANFYQTTYISEPKWDEVLQAYYIEIAMPILDTNEITIGMIYVNFSLTNTFKSLSPEISNGQTIGIAKPDGTIIFTNGNPESEIKMPLQDITPGASGESWRTVQTKIGPQLYSYAGLTISEDADFHAKWNLVNFLPTDQALSRLYSARTNTLFTALVIFVLSLVTIMFLTHSITHPLFRLTEAAEEIISGNVNVKVDIEGEDELATMATSFNRMTAQISTMVSEFEQTIDARTKDLQLRAVQMETASLIAREAAEVQDLTHLLDLVTTLISEKFGYYHAGIFLLDEQRKYAVLQAANSEGGKRMLARSHKLQVGRVGVVGYCAGTGQPRIAQDVGADIVYYDNPDMPNTRSEMALPLIVRDKVIGVLDVQSTEASAFTQDDIAILQLMTDQIALAIDNTRLLQSSQRALEELQVLYGQQASLAWQQKLTGQQVTYQYASTGLITQPESQGTPHKSEETRGHLLKKDIHYRGQIIGSLNLLRDDEEHTWSQDEQDLIDEILEQTALALENARLVEQIRLRSDQIRLLQEITAMAASILDEQELLTTITEKLQTSLHIPHCGIAIFDASASTAKLAASSAQVSIAPALGTTIIIDEDPISQKIIRSRQMEVFRKIQDEAQFEIFTKNLATPDTSLLILLPLIVLDEVAGYIYLEEINPDRGIDNEETNLFRQLSAQVSTALESVRLFSAEQQGRQAAAALLEITQIASASLDLNKVLSEATQRSASAVQANRCTIFLLDDQLKIKPILSEKADGTQMPEGEWQELQDKITKTYRNIPLAKLAAILRKPQHIEDLHTFKEFPLDWAKDSGVQRLLMVPLISQNKVIGTMVYDQVETGRAFSLSQINLAQTISGQIATTIENANLFDQTVRRAERERQVTEITAKIRSSNDPQEILKTAISELRLALTTSELQSPANPKAKQPKESAQPSSHNGKDESLDE